VAVQSSGRAAFGAPLPPKTVVTCAIYCMQLLHAINCTCNHGLSCRGASPLLARSQHRSRLALSTDTRALSTDLVRISMRCCNFVWCCFVASTCRCIDRYLLWPPCVADVDIIFSSCGFFNLFSSPNLSRRSLDVYHTSTHDVALVRI